MQLQMLLCKKRKGLFCVAPPDFETKQTVNIVEVDYDETFVSDLMEKIMLFWKKCIFSKLVK